MIPVLTPEEMGAVDRAAPEPTSVLIGRAGAAVARAAVAMLGGTYGRRVVVVAGKGNNGNDGRDAARRLAARGVRVRVVEAADRAAPVEAADRAAPVEAADRAAPVEAADLADCDLIIDAAYGTGFHGSYRWPTPARSTSGPRRSPPVLSVDIPSGVDGLTGHAEAGVGSAALTVTFAALKPGLLFEPGAGLAGDVVVADIGLDVSGARVHLVEDADVATWWPTRPAASHKWRSAVWVVAGSPGMGGAAALASGGAQRTGAGYVRLSSPGGRDQAPIGVEVVGVDLPRRDWAGEVVDGLDRFGALVIGNGLGTDDETRAEIRSVLAGVRQAAVPTVVDADGLTALGDDAVGLVGPHTILTPHDGEFARLAGHPPGADRLAAARDLAARLGCVVVLKGGPTVVASAAGDALVVASGDARLATAGTGDVLAGVIGALAARGLDPWRAAAAGAFLHGQAGALGWRDGLVAADVVDHLPQAIERITTHPTI
jgi:ADP-dependent NAD(P)H-hydrate dehydratase / NAD(P)H-hydrate epimerase